MNNLSCDKATVSLMMPDTRSVGQGTATRAPGCVLRLCSYTFVAQLPTCSNRFLDNCTAEAPGTTARLTADRAD